jgi:hypothetical protein
MSVQFVDWRGQTRTVSLPLDTDVTADAVANAMGDMSNAAVFGFKQNVISEKSITEVTAFDEAESSVNLVAVFVFATALGSYFYAEVPAPDASLFSADKQSLDPTKSLVTAFISAVEAGNDGYTYSRNFVVTRKGSRVGTKLLPQLAEPTTTSNPPPETPR